MYIYVFCMYSSICSRRTLHKLCAHELGHYSAIPPYGSPTCEARTHAAGPLQQRAVVAAAIRPIRVQAWMLPADGADSHVKFGVTGWSQDLHLGAIREIMYLQAPCSRALQIPKAAPDGEGVYLG